MELVAGRCHASPSEPMAHGRDRQPARRQGRLRLVAAPGWSDPLRPPMEPTAQGPGPEEAYEGGTRGLHDACVEAVRRRNGTGLPALATTPDQMKRSGRTLARLQGCDVVASRSCGGNCAEESVRLAVRTGREEQRVDRTVVHRPMPELQRPEPVDDELASVGRPKRSDELERPVGQLLVRVHVAVSEVAHEQVAAEPSETRGGEREAPRCIQLPALRYADEQIPIGVEGVNEAEALAVDLVLRSRTLLRERHEDSRTDRLDPERRVTGGKH